MSGDFDQYDKQVDPVSESRQLIEEAIDQLESIDSDEATIEVSNAATFLYEALEALLNAKRKASRLNRSNPSLDYMPEPNLNL
jgi:hypothetical protein